MGDFELPHADDGMPGGCRAPTPPRCCCCCWRVSTLAGPVGETSTLADRRKNLANLAAVRRHQLFFLPYFFSAEPGRPLDPAFDALLGDTLFWLLNGRNDEPFLPEAEAPSFPAFFLDLLSFSKLFDFANRNAASVASDEIVEPIVDVVDCIALPNVEPNVVTPMLCWLDRSVSSPRSAPASASADRVVGPRSGRSVPSFSRARSDRSELGWFESTFFIS